MINTKPATPIQDTSEKKALARRRRRVGWLVFTASLIVVVIALILLPRLINRDQEEADSHIVSAEVTAADIETTIRAAGTLLDTEATYITVPEGVELEYAVKNGDLLAPGDLIAAVDETSVMLTIAELQSAMDTIDTRIEEARDGETATSITAPADARVKAVYAASGNSVSEVMYNNGALLVLSLDGRMAVDIDSGFVSAGEGVSVTLSDGTVVEGRVSSIAGNIASVTISDNGPIPGDHVLVHNEDGMLLGERELYIHSELKITGYYGTVDQVNVSVDESITSGTELLTITSADTSAGYAGLLAQRHEMEDQMETLFKIYQRGGIYAEESGYAAEIETDGSMLMPVSLTGGEPGIVLLSDVQEAQDTPEPTETPAPTAQPTNTPTPTAEPTPTPAPSSTPEPTVAPTDTPVPTEAPSDSSQPTEDPGETPVPTEEPVESPQPTEDPGQADSSDEPTASPQPTEDPVETPAPTEEPEEAPEPSETPEPVVGTYEDVYARVDAVTEGEFALLTAEPDAYIHYGDYAALKALAYTAGAQIKPEENITVFLHENGEWSIVDAAQIQTGDYLVLTYFSSNQSEQLMWIICNRGDSQGSTPGGSDEPTNSATPSPGASPDSSTSGEMGSNSGSGSTRSNSGSPWSSGSQSGAGTPAGMMSQVQTYTLSEIQVCAITPDTNMTVEIQIDELDILSIYEGQEVALVLDALNGQRFMGTVTDIANEATNNGGSAKFTVEITLQREVDMRTGMNAAVTIHVSETKALCAIPVEALVEEGAETFVYTGYDEKNDELKDPVMVTTGVSDGVLVEILSGLEAGMTVYYKYLGTLSEIVI